MSNLQKFILLYIIVVLATILAYSFTNISLNTREIIEDVIMAIFITCSITYMLSMVIPFKNKYTA